MEGSNETLRAVAAVVLCLSALVAIYFAVRPTWREPSEQFNRTLAAGGALAALASSYFFFDLISDTNTSSGWARAGFITLAIGLSAIGALLLLLALARIVRAASGQDPKFAAIAGYSAASGALLLFAVAAGVPAGWWDAPFESNFEIFLIAGATIIAVLVSWGTRAWANAAPVGHFDARSRVAFNLSLVFASAVGVLVFVSIGASAFAARLAQREIMALQGQTASVPLERIQEAVHRLILLDRRIAAAMRAEARQEQAFHDTGQSPEARTIVFEAEQLAFWRQAEIVRQQIENSRSAPAIITSNLGWRAVGDLIIVNRSGEREPPPFERSSSIILSAFRQAADEIESASQSASVRDEIAVLERHWETARDTDIARLVSEDQRRQWQVRIENLQLQQNCELHKLAADITEGARGGEGQPRALANTVTAPSDCRAGQTFAADLAAARRVVGAARPLGRSTMSHALARRAPITLSIELVLVMGALGALLQSISLQLVGMVRTPTANQPEPPPTTLISLSLHIVFGMATALALFVLLNMAIGASSLSVRDDAPRGDDLDPFAMAAVGLLGGFASLGVADWMKRTADDLLSGLPRGARVAPQPPQPPAPTAPPGNAVV